MAEPTQGELLHARVLQTMQTLLINREDMQGVTVKTMNEIAREAAGTAKRHFENSKST